MMESGVNQTVFIVDLYNKYCDKDKVRQIFYLNGRWWSILETTLEWGTPRLDRIDEDEYTSFYIYNTLEEAQDFVKQLKQNEGMKF